MHCHCASHPEPQRWKFSCPCSFVSTLTHKNRNAVILILLHSRRNSYGGVTSMNESFTRISTKALRLLYCSSVFLMQSCMSTIHNKFCVIYLLHKRLVSSTLLCMTLSSTFLGRASSEIRTTTGTPFATQQKLVVQNVQCIYLINTLAFHLVYIPTSSLFIRHKSPLPVRGSAVVPTLAHWLETLHTLLNCFVADFLTMFSTYGVHRNLALLTNKILLLFILKKTVSV